MPVFQLSEQPFFPHPDLAEENGLLAVGGDLRPERLIAAYQNGIFPWYAEGDPLLWWFTSPRLVLFPRELRVSRRLARKMRQNPFTITFDQAFDQVINGCAVSRTGKGQDTWILPEMQKAYTDLHRLGYAHSIECWQGSTLAGGLYGVRLDRVFFGESMFTRVSDASKVALVTLVRLCLKKDIRLIDCQMTTNHLLSFGAREISGKSFQKQIERYIQSTTPDGQWNHEQEYQESGQMPRLRQP